jgi:hypothetical protein
MNRQARKDFRRIFPDANALLVLVHVLTVTLSSNEVDKGKNTPCIVFTFIDLKSSINAPNAVNSKRRTLLSSTQLFYLIPNSDFLLNSFPIPDLSLHLVQPVKIRP